LEGFASIWKKNLPIYSNSPAGERTPQKSLEDSSFSMLFLQLLEDLSTTSHQPAAYAEAKQQLPSLPAGR
jgi:hypothetical protein